MVEKDKTDHSKVTGDAGSGSMAREKNDMLAILMEMRNDQNEQATVLVI